MGSPRVTTRRTARLALALPVIALIAACGTTVPLTTTVGTSGSGSGTTAASLGSAGDVSGGTSTVSGGGQPLATSSADPGVPSGTVSATGAGGLAPTPGAGTGTAATPGAGGSLPGTTAPSKPGATKPSANAKTKTGKSATPTATKSSAAASGGVASSAPLKIGFEYFDDASGDAADAAAGVSAQHSLTQLATLDALVKYQNDHGGLGGRQVTIVPHSENDQSTNFASDAQAGCTYFTQDSPVPIVIDFAWGAGFGFNTCLTKAGIEDISGPQPADAASLGANPFEVHPGNLTPDRAYSDALVQLVKAGTLKAGTKIGVFMDNCAGTTAAYANTIGPTFKRLGLVPDTFSANCIGGYGGLGGASTSASSAVLQFRGNGDTQVMMISENDSTYWVLFGAASGSQDYNPGLIMTSYSEPTATEGSFTSAQIAGIHGVGWIPVLDTTNPKLPGTAIESTCDAEAAAEQVSPTSNNDQYYIYTLCEPVVLLKAAFALDASNATAPVLSKAIASLGTTTSIPGILGGLSDFSHQDAPADVQLFSYQAACSCLAYSGSPTPA